MMLIASAAAVLAASADVPRRPAPTVQARATVRILSGVRLKLGEDSARRDGPAVRDATVRTTDGRQPAKLIEFE